MIRTLSSGLEDRHAAINAYTAIHLVIEDRFELSSPESNSEMLPLHHSIFFAVRTGIEPVATDRQSVMLAVTLTNRDSGVLIDAILHAIVSKGLQSVPGSNWYHQVESLISLTIRRTDHLYSRQDSNLQPLQSKWSIQPLECYYILFSPI